MANWQPSHLQCFPSELSTLCHSSSNNNNHNITPPPLIGQPHSSLLSSDKILFATSQWIINDYYLLYVAPSLH